MREEGGVNLVLGRVELRVHTRALELDVCHPCETAALLSGNACVKLACVDPLVDNRVFDLRNKENKLAFETKIHAEIIGL